MKLVWGHGILVISRAGGLSSTVKISKSVVRQKIERQGSVPSLKDTLNHKIPVPEFIKDISHTLFVHNESKFCSNRTVSSGRIKSHFNFSIYLLIMDKSFQYLKGLISMYKFTAI